MNFPLLRLISLLAVTGILACGEDAPEPAATAEGSAPAVQRLPLEVASDAQEHEPIEVLHLGVDSARDWKIEADQHRTITFPGSDQPALLLMGETRRSVTVPMDLVRSSFNRLEFRLLTRVNSSLVVSFSGPGEFRAQAQREIAASPAPQWISVDVLDRRESDNPVRHMRLEFSKGGPSVALDSLRLIKMPVEEFAPRSLDLAEAAGELRVSMGATTTSALTTSFSARGDETLVFSAAPVERLHRELQKLTLKVRVETEADPPSERTVSLPTGAWTDCEIKVSEFDGREFDVRFELQAPGSVASSGHGAGALVSQPRLERRQTEVQSVLLVTSDTHRADHLGMAIDGAGVRTPVIDSLAARGLMFDNCFSATNVTNPSHISIMTGTHPRDTGIVNNWTRLNRSAPTLAEAFAGAGYLTFACISVPHLADPVSGLGQGFDRASLPERVNDADYTVKNLKSWLEAADGLPVFVWLHVFDAHTPYDPPGDYRDEYYSRDQDPRDPSLPESVPPDRIKLWFPGVRDLEYPKALYRGEVTYLDEELGKIVNLPRFRNGIVAVTADHGENLGEHDIYYDHAGLYPQSIHVPMVIAFPAAEDSIPAGGRRVARPVTSLDLGRTLLDLAGVATDFPGTSLIENTAPRPRYCLSAHVMTAAINAGPWHLVMHLRDFTAPRHPDRQIFRHATELYNLEDDAAAEHDLLDRHLEKARELRDELIDWLNSAEVRGWDEAENTDPELADQLKNLGYAEVESSPREALFDRDCECEYCARFVR